MTLPVSVLIHTDFCSGNSVIPANLLESHCLQFILRKLCGYTHFCDFCLRCIIGFEHELSLWISMTSLRKRQTHMRLLPMVTSQFTDLILTIPLTFTLNWKLCECTSRYCNVIVRERKWTTYAETKSESPSHWTWFLTNSSSYFFRTKESFRVGEDRSLEWRSFNRTLLRKVPFHCLRTYLWWWGNFIYHLRMNSLSVNGLINITN